jgi:hypothetical protein
LQNEEDQARVRAARAGEVVHLSEPPVAILVRCPSIEASVAARQIQWPEDHTLVDGSVVIPIFQSKKATEIKRKGPISTTTFKMFGFDVELGFSVTFHKIQGQTIDKLVIDLNKRPKELGHLSINAVFVALSRVRTSQSIRLVPRHSTNSFDYLYKLKYQPYLKDWYSLANRVIARTPMNLTMSNSSTSNNNNNNNNNNNQAENETYTRRYSNGEEAQTTYKSTARRNKSNARNFQCLQPEKKA